jgi:hypothetical protein
VQKAVIVYRKPHRSRLREFCPPFHKKIVEWILAACAPRGAHDVLEQDGIGETVYELLILVPALHVDDFVVREILDVPPNSTGFHNSLNLNEFRTAEKRHDSEGQEFVF